MYPLTVGLELDDELGPVAQPENRAATAMASKQIFKTFMLEFP